MTHEYQKAQARERVGRVGRGVVTLAGVAALTGAMALLGPVGTAAATTVGPLTCSGNGTSGRAQYSLSLHQAATTELSGVCGTMAVRGKYTVTTTGKQYWSSYVLSSSNAVYTTTYGIGQSEHFTTGTPTKTLYL